MKRVILLLLDGVGCGELPDASKYGDSGSNTLANIALSVGNRHACSLQLPNLKSLGLGNIISIKGVAPVSSPLANYGKAKERSVGKDSTTGHWELMGVVIDKPFPTYPEGFPKSMILKFQSAIGKQTLGGLPASGTQIIEDLGEKHIKTGYPIIYTSADSVFQIAAHKSIISLGELYKMCEIARTLFPEIGRVIARPFIGEKAGSPDRNFKRTPERKDYSLPPPDLTLLDLLTEKGIKVTTIGKIDYLFAQRGITQAIHTKNNQEVGEKTIQIMDSEKNGFIFSNFIDFDQLWGHRNDIENFAKALYEFDCWLPNVLERLTDDDILFITADHGNDPTTPSTDHSREYIPILVYGKKLKTGVNLGTRESFADIGATIGELFGIALKKGCSFLSQIKSISANQSISGEQSRKSDNQKKPDILVF